MAKSTRFSDLDWYSENTREIMVVGAGGIGSFTIFNLSRIGFPLYIVDPDGIDETNVSGGQLYRTKDIGKSKVEAVSEIVKEFGCTNSIIPFNNYYSAEIGTTPIMITGLDNIKARKECFETWVTTRNELPIDYKEGDEFTGADDFLFIDGRLNAEQMEVFCVQGNRPEQIEAYKEYLFNDEEIPDAPCSAKQTSFAAMGIANIIVASLCNWLTNRKLGEEFREIPFKQSFFLPLFKYDITEINENVIV